MSDEVYSAMTTLRQFLYNNVYSSASVHNEFVKAKKILSELYSYFLDNEMMLKKELAGMKMADFIYKNQPKELSACDIIASMTDRYAMNLYSKLFFPSPLV
ncbi:MAG: hypothetical protein U9R43_18305 [Thermodesulfobacteriota bacterium]|nr:hypothetical protein [Thermodesulfobacteriota bacterium]